MSNENVTVGDMKDNRKKKSKSLSLDDNLINKLEALDKRGDFGNQSNIATIALYNFFDKYVPDEINERDVKEIIITYLKGPEGRELIRSVIQNILISDENKEKVRNHE